MLPVLVLGCDVISAALVVLKPMIGYQAQLTGPVTRSRIRFVYGHRIFQLVEKSIYRLTL